MADSETPTVGELLLRRRQESGLDVKAFAERTRISCAYLRALEENRFDALPGEAYLTGFLRVYAGALGLQPEAVMAQYRHQTGRSEASAEAGKARNVITSPTALPRRRRPASLGWLTAMVLAGAALALVSVTLPHGGKTVMPAKEEIAAAPGAVAPSAGGTALPPASTAGETAALEMPGSLPALPIEAEAPASPMLPVQATLPPSAASATALANPATLPVRTMPASPPAESAAADPDPLTFTFPGNRQLRLQVLGPNTVEIHADDRQPQHYDFTAPAVVSWRVRQTARVRIEHPAVARVWLDEKPIDLGTRNEFSVHAVETVVNR